jgi:hypothetical protein
MDSFLSLAIWRIWLWKTSKRILVLLDSLMVIVSEYRGEVDGHFIRFKTSSRGIQSLIDNVLIDSTGVLFLVNYLLTGKVGDKQIKVRIALFFGTRCKVFIEQLGLTGSFNNCLDNVLESKKDFVKYRN